jgi:hypothetical protein
MPESGLRGLHAFLRERLQLLLLLSQQQDQYLKLMINSVTRGTGLIVG